MIGRILVALGGTDYTMVAIETAVELAKRHNAELTGVTVVDLEKLRRIGAVPLGAGDLANELRDERVAQTREAAELTIARFEEACKEAGLKHQVLRQEHDEPGHCLIQLSRYQDLAVMGLKSIFDYGVPNTTEDPVKMIDKLVTGGVRPIVAVPNQPFVVKKALIAYSGSMGAAKTIRQFVRLNPWPGVETKIVTFGKETDENRQLLEDSAAYCVANGLSPSSEIIDASPNQGILDEAAGWGADIIVLGNSQKSLLMRRVLGETVLHVIKNSEKALFLGQ